MDKLLLWLHIGLAIFSVGPVTMATMASPRYIRARDVVVLRYLARSTRIFGLLTLGVLLAGIALGGSNLAQPYLVISLTLFVVAAALLFVIDHDQQKAIKLLSNEEEKDDAKVQTGRIATLSGVVGLIWLVILFLMIFY